MLPDAKPPRFPLIRSREQSSLFLVISICFVALIVYWCCYFPAGGSGLDIRYVEPEKVDFVVDINHSKWPELSLFPGVGEGLARRIVDYRNENGPFTSVEELTKVRGIGPTKLEKIKPFLAPIGRIDKFSAVLE